MKMTDHQRVTVLKAQNEALTEKQMDFTQYVPYHMQVVNSVAIDTDTYQREVEEDKVRDIVAGFNEYIANEPKLSYRNGKYYAFDGQHTIEARKRLNGNKDCDIVCKVFFGMTPEEEARLFAAQTGTSSKPSTGAEWAGEGTVKIINHSDLPVNYDITAENVTNAYGPLSINITVGTGTVDKCNVGDARGSHNATATFKVTGTPTVAEIAAQKLGEIKVTITK